MTDGRDYIARQTRLLRTIAIALAGVSAAVLQGFAGHWFGLGLAVFAAGFWIAIRDWSPVRVAVQRAAPGLVPIAVQTAFVVLGVLHVWRLVFPLLPLAVFGMWMLVAAMDLDRLGERFPLLASRAEQRGVLRVHLRGLGALGGASAAVAIVASVLTVELRLVTVVLLAILIVVVVRYLVDALLRNVR